MNRSHRQSARPLLGNGSRSPVTGLAATGERGPADPDIPAVLREHPGQAGQQNQRLGGGLPLPEERPVYVLRIPNRTPVVAQVEHHYDHGWMRVRLWMGLKWPRGVRWSHTPRTVNEADLIRLATPREATLGHPA